MPREEITIQDLEKDLTGYVSKAAQGETFAISEHGRVLACLVPVLSEHVWEGPDFGHADIRPLFPGRPIPRAREILDEDREDEEGRT